MENRNEEEAREASCSKRELMLEAIVRKTCACDLVVDLTSGSYSTLIGKGVYAKLSALVGDAGDYDALMRRVLPAMTPAYRAIFEADFGLERLRLLRDSDEPGPCGTFPIELGGEWHWFEIQSVGPVAGTGLAVANVLIRNVTAEAEERDRRQKERAAAETSEAILHKLVGSLFGYILTIDLETLKYRLVAGTGLETSVRFLSQQDDYRVAYAAKMSHLNEAHARQMEDCFAPEKLQAEAAGGRRGFYRLIEHEAVVMGSRFWEEMSVYFGTDDAGRRVAIALIRDVTEAHDRFDAEREADRRANEAKSYFFSSVSHDIRTPLNAIVGYAELLRAGIEAASERDQALEAIVSNGHMLKELINDVLDLSKLESGKMEVHPEPSDVARLVREVLGSFALVCGRAGVRLVREVYGVPQVMVDSQRLRQILFNLVGNAVKFTKQGSITVSAAYADGRLVLSVKDTGCGIDPQYHGRLMQPFVQAPVGGRHDGTGLGLAICRQLAKRMGGDLSLESEVGKGSVFTLSIPVAVASDCDATDRRQEAGGGLAPRLARDPTSTRVLIVDDSPVNLKVLSAMLKRVGCKSVIQADGGRSALEVLQAGNVDLVLTDLWMPDVDGQELVRAIRSQSEYASLPVYAVTADVEAVKDAAAKGFTGILLKPMTLQMLSGLFAGS